MGCKKQKGTDRKVQTNWKVYDLAMKNEDTWFIQHALEILDEMPEPWEEHTMGRPPTHPPKSLVLALLIKVKHRRTYRGIESFLREDDRYKKLGFATPPGKSTLQEAMEKVPESYLKDVEKRLSERLKKQRRISS